MGQHEEAGSFRDGKPSSLDIYWQASGNVLHNGAIYGAYRLQPLPQLGLIKFVLEPPNETLELEGWNATL